MTKPSDPPPLTTPPFPTLTPSRREQPPGDFGSTPGLDVPNTAPFPFPVPDEGVGPNVESFPKNPCPGGGLIPPFLESDQSSGAENLPNLISKTRNEARQELRNKGFDYRGVTPGGYEKWYHPDGSRVQIRPNGEVTRQGPKIIPTDGGKNTVLLLVQTVKGLQLLKKFTILEKIYCLKSRSI